MKHQSLMGRIKWQTKKSSKIEDWKKSPLPSVKNVADDPNYIVKENGQIVKKVS